MHPIDKSGHPLRVLNLTNSMSVGGAESLIYNWASLVQTSSILSKKIDIEVCTLSEVGFFGKKLVDQGVPVHCLETFNVYAPQAIWKIVKFLQGMDYDIIHVHLFPSSLFASLASIVSKKYTWIYTEHNVWNRRRQWKWFKLIDRFIYSRYTQILGVSTPVQYSLIAWLPELADKTLALPNSVNINRFRLNKSIRITKRHELGITPEQKLLLFIGRLTEAKGIDVLLRALNTADYWIENSVLLVVGEGPQNEELKKLGERLNLNHRVRFLGVREDIPALLAAADVFILPSRWEGLPMVILEAMAAGKPIVTSSVGGIPEVIDDGKTGLLVPPEDVMSLRNALSQIITEEPYGYDLGNAARRKAEKLFSIEASIQQLIRIYHKVL